MSELQAQYVTPPQVVEALRQTADCAECGTSDSMEHATDAVLGNPPFALTSAGDFGLVV